jgi:hypothetical protein
VIRIRLVALLLIVGCSDNRPRPGTKCSQVGAFYYDKDGYILHCEADDLGRGPTWWYSIKAHWSEDYLQENERDMYLMDKQKIKERYESLSQTF